jgi:arylsulfatase A-like enzyme
MLDAMNHLKLIAWFFTLLSIGVTAAEPRPNILLIVADDLGYGDLSCYGSEIATPQIDSLARDGVRFTDFYVAASTCTPSRFALLTGRAPIRSRDGLLNPLAFGDAHDADRGIRAEETTIATRLREVGYRTAIIGKWHLGHGDPSFLPTRHGFDSFFGFTGGAVDYFTFRYGKQPDLHRDEDVVDEPSFVTQRLTAEAVRFLKTQTVDKPFFLYLPHLAPHFGKAWDENKQAAVNILQPRAEELARVPHIKNKHRRDYAAMLTALDDGVGEVLAALRSRGLEQNTLVIFMSDNGGSIPHGSFNHPMRGMKTQLYEGGIRVPCLVRWPEKITAGRIIRQPASALDWFPTFSQLAGIKPDATPLDGHDITSLLTTDTPQPERPFFWSETAAQRDGGKSSHAIRLGKWKLLQTPDGKSQLFDLATDMDESNDLGFSQIEQQNQLEAQLGKWLEDISAILSPKPIGW